MKKKDYVIWLLERFKENLPMARWILLLLQNGTIDDAFLDIIIKSFQDNIDNAKNETEKSSLEKAKKFLQKLKEKEQNDNDDNLEALLQNI